MIALWIGAGAVALVLVARVLVAIRRDTREQPPVSAKWLDEHVYGRKGGDR